MTGSRRGPVIHVHLHKMPLIRDYVENPWSGAESTQK